MTGMGMYYKMPPEKPPPWWAEVFVLTRAVFGILFWPLAVIVAAIAALVMTFFLFSVHWTLGVLMIIAIIAAIGAFAWWDSHRMRPPQM